MDRTRLGSQRVRTARCISFPLSTVGDARRLAHQHDLHDSAPSGKATGTRCQRPPPGRASRTTQDRLSYGLAPAPARRRGTQLAAKSALGSRQRPHSVNLHASSDRPRLLQLADPFSNGVGAQTDALGDILIESRASRSNALRISRSIASITAFSFGTGNPFPIHLCAPRRGLRYHSVMTYEVHLI